MRAAQVESLPPDARRIAEILEQLSMAVYGEVWHDRIEHDVWQAIYDPGADRAALGLDAPACAELRHLADRAGGWAMWSGGPRFVPDGTWRMFHAVWRMTRE